MRQHIVFSIFISCLFCIAVPCWAVGAAGYEANVLLFEKALAESREGNFLDALENWNRFILLFPDDAIALSNRGNVLLALGDKEGAIRDQNKAIELLPLEIDPHLNRGIAEEALMQWDLAKLDYQWILEREPENASALYNLGNVMAAQNDWLQSKELFNQAFLAKPDFVMARSSKALACYQLHQFDQAEKELRAVIRKYPLFADSRAALSALLWRKGFAGEAESHWAAASGLENRYKQEDWLLNIRRWPPEPISDLMSFLQLKKI